MILGSMAVESQEAQPESTTAQDEREAMRARIESLERQIEKIENEGETETSREEIKVLAREEALAAVEERELTTGLEEYDVDEVSFRVYGFYDVTFVKNFFNKDHGYNYVLSGASTFMISNINLYFDSQLSENLSSLLELRFSFLPLGSEEHVYVEVDGTRIPDYEYERVDTRVYDPYTSENYELNGVAVERVHLTYSPRQWFNVTVGRYLTPFGIWNVDHASTVYVPATIPYFHVREMVPIAQTGLQVFGRVFPSERFFIDYAVTLSNGRGPIESVVDLDENKGVGLRLKLNYEGDAVRFSLGGYGYYGEYTDLHKTVSIDTAAPTVDTLLTTTSNYDELDVSGDFLLELFGVRAQVEYVYRYVIQNKAEMMGSIETIGATNSILGTYFIPSYTGWGIFAILSYELPLEKWIYPVRISPFVLYDGASPEDFMQLQDVQKVGAGFNIKFSRNVVTKVAGRAYLPDSDMFGGKFFTLLAQLAVSF